MSRGKCGKCGGRGFTNEAIPVGDGINVRFDPVELQPCDCSTGKARRPADSGVAEQRG